MKKTINRPVILMSIFLLFATVLPAIPLEDRKSLIDAAKAELWRGNYHESSVLLERYRESFGETYDYLSIKARLLATGRRSDKAMEIIRPILEQDPDNYDVNVSRTIALYYGNRPAEALESIDILVRLNPDSRETEDIRKLVQTPFRPAITAGAEFYSDSDDLDILNTFLQAGYSITPLTRLNLGIRYDILRGETGSGLENIDGSREAFHYHAWFGIEHRLSPQVFLDMNMGAAEAEGNEIFTYKVRADLQLHDTFVLSAGRNSGFYVISPRALSLDIRRDVNRLFLQWEPDFLYTVLTEMRYETFSDGNERWEVLFAPRRALVRKEKYNMDLGLSAQIFGFDEDMDNGYYDPELYQRYMAVGFLYWKISDNDGIGIVLSAGLQKDETMDDFRFGGGIDTEGTFGIYRDWMLNLRAGAILNSRQITSAFHAYRIGASIQRRF